MHITRQQFEVKENPPMFANQFVVKLYEMLQTADEESVISWQPDSRSFSIRDSKRFVEEVLPRYYANSKLGCFQGQLRSYGFQHTKSGRDCNVYSHELFLRGCPDLLQKIKPKRASTVGKPTLVGLTTSIAASLIKKDRVGASKAGASPLDRQASQPNKDTWIKGEDHKESFKPPRTIGIPQKDQGENCSMSPLETRCGPLHVPGRLRAQPATAPTAVRFVPTPNLPRYRERAAAKWVKCLQLMPISRELDDNNWGDEKTATPSSDKSKCESPRQ